MARNSEKELGFVERLAKIQSPLWIQILAAIDFYFMFYLIQGSVYALVFLFSMIFHEIGHFLIFRISGVVAKIMLIFPLGAVAIPINKEEDDKSNRLAWNTLVWMINFGPIFNIILIGFGVYLRNIGGYQELSSLIILINMSLAIINLVPIWKFDGGQVFNIIIASLDQRGREVLARSYILVTYLLFIIVIGLPALNGWREMAVSFISNAGLVFVAIFTILGIWLKQGLKIDHLEIEESDKLTILQIILHIAIHTILLLSAMFIPAIF